MKYQAPYGSSDPNASYVNGDPTVSQEGSIPPAAMMEHPQRELINAFLLASLNPAQTDLTQLGQAMSIGIFLGAFTGTANALTATLPGSISMAALVAGMTFHGYISGSSNTAAANLTLSGFSAAPGAKPIKRRNGGTDVSAGDLSAGTLVSFRYDGASFRYVGLTASDVADVIATAGAQSVLTVIQTQFLITSAIVKTVHGVGADFADLNAAMAWVSKYQIAHGGSVTFNVAVGQFIYTTPVVLDHPNQNAITINGAALTGAAPTGSTFACTGNSSGARATDAAANLTALRGIYSTELRFTGGIGGFVSTGALPTLSNLLVTGDGGGTEASGANGIAVYAGANFLNVSSHGFGGDGLQVRGSLININSGRSLTVSACAQGSASGGINLQSGASLFYAGNVVVSGCNANGVSLSASSVTQNGGSLISKGNASNGVTLNDGGCSFTGGPGCAYLTNGANGVVSFLGDVDVHSAALGGNASYGLAMNQGYANAQACSFTPGNGAGTLKADSGGNINAQSAATNGTESPAVNTPGNGNSYIRN